MRTTIDKAGRLVIPRQLRDQVGLANGGEVDVELDGAALRIEPVVGTGFVEENGFLVIPASGHPITDEDIRRMIDEDRNAPDRHARG